jgi:diguanylate cyclase (GGDEF)-like protein
MLEFSPGRFKMPARPKKRRMSAKPSEIPASIPRDRPLRVLLVEDDRDDAVLFEKALHNLGGLKFELTVVHSYADGAEKSRSGSFDLHFVDLRLGLDSGLRLVTETLAHDNRKAFVIITGAGDERLAADAIRKGAADYLPKAALTKEVLLQCIANCYTVPENRTIKLQLEYRPAFDKQTDVYSHELFLRAARNRLAANLGVGASWCLLVIDIDHFKQIRDEKIASNALRLVAQAIRASLSDTEPVGRCGPDEFCVLLSCSGISEAADVAEEIRAAVERSTQFTVSIGVACHAAASADLDGLVREAAQAVQEAAEQGHNQVRP